MQSRRCSLVLVLTCAVFQTVRATGYEQSYCSDLKPQNTLDLGQIMGMWYGVEIIPHLREEDGVVISDSCPVVHLSETTYDPSGQGPYENSGSYSSIGQGQYDRSGSYPPTGQTHYDRSGSYPPGGRGQYEQSGAYLPTGQGQYDRSGNYPQPGQGLYDRTNRLGSYPPTGQEPYDNSGSYLSSVQGQYGRSGSYPLATTDNNVRPGDYGYNWNTGMGYPNSVFGDKEYRHLRLYWDEADNTVEYNLKFNNTRRGFWISSGPQNGQIGTLLERKYNQFAGTVQVMKAVGDHLVLTFCQRLPESQLFSVILARQPHQLGRQVIHSIHNLLNRRDLSTSSVRKVCRNGSPGADAPLGTMTALTLIAVSAYFGARKV